MQKHYLFNGSETPEEIERVLLDNCAGVEQMKFTKPLSEIELAARREKLADNHISIGEETEILKAAKDAYKEAVTPVKAENKAVLKEIKTRHAEVEGRVFKMPNHETGYMEYVDETGAVVYTRRLAPEEKQGSILGHMRKAVNE